MYRHGALVGMGDDSKLFPLTYKTWRSMRARCLNPNNSYAKGGIKICRRWLDYSNFLKDMGPRPSAKHEIDRLDSKKNYTRTNCRWATAKQQVENLPQNQKGYRHKHPHRNHALGEDNGSAILNEKAVRMIRNSKASCRKLARLFSVSNSAVERVRLGLTWRHV